MKKAKKGNKTIIMNEWEVAFFENGTNLLNLPLRRHGMGGQNKGKRWVIEEVPQNVRTNAITPRSLNHIKQAKCFKDVHWAELNCTKVGLECGEFLHRREYKVTKTELNTGWIIQPYPETCKKIKSYDLEPEGLELEIEAVWYVGKRTLSSNDERNWTDKIIFWYFEV